MANNSETDYYQILFLKQKESNSAKIKENYSTLIKIFHPDKQGISEISQKLTESYHVLSDPVLKFIYDNLGKESTDLIKASETLSLKSRKVFDSITFNPLNNDLVDLYKAYLVNKIKQKISRTNDSKHSDVSQVNLIYSPQNSSTAMTIQHNPTKNTSIGFHYEPNKKQQSYFIKHSSSFLCLSSESLYAYNRSSSNAKAKPITIHQTLRFKQAFASSSISFSNNKISFTNSTFGFNIASFLFAFNRQSGLMINGSHLLTHNGKLSYSLTFLHRTFSIQTSDSYKKYNDTKELVLNSKGITLSNEIYNKDTGVVLNSSLALGHASNCLFNLSIGFKSNNFSFLMPLIVYSNFDWVSCLLLSLPYLYSKYITRKSWKGIYSIYDKISKNNHNAFIETNGESLHRLAHDDSALSIGLALVGRRDLIRAFLKHFQSGNNNQRIWEYGVFDITIALSLKISRLGTLTIGRDIFEIEGVYLPQYRYRDDMWYYIQYTRQGVDNTIFLLNKSENVEIA